MDNDYVSIHKQSCFVLFFAPSVTSPNAIESKRAFINNTTGVTSAEGISYEVKLMRFVMISYAKIIYQDFEDLVKVSLNNIIMKRSNFKID